MIMLRNTKVLITGGAGYLGSVLTERLLNLGYLVTVLDNFRHGVPSLLHLCDNPNLTVIKADAHHQINNYILGYDAIIPLAAVVGAPACNHDVIAAVSTNQEAISLLVQYASNDQLIIYPNTNSGYGSTGSGECTEDTTIGPISLYAKTKAAAEAEVLRHPLGISLRFATLFGCSPRMRLDLLVNDFTYRAVRDRALTIFEGNFRRNYL
ncbi:MAG: SDR family oxidoreductase, partial [Candidatus Binatia bacterium]|nr:SDR family oxidoreductase [Candidatus Binatia bacterium]